MGFWGECFLLILINIYYEKYIRVRNQKTLSVIVYRCYLSVDIKMFVQCQILLTL